MIYRFNQIELDSENFRLLVNNKETSVEPQVFNLIVFLIENKDTCVSRDRILDHVWKGRVVSDTSINNHIKSARKVLGDDGTKQQVIKTIHSRGYQFVAEITNPDKPSSQNTSKAQNTTIAKKAMLVIGLIAIMIMAYLLVQKDSTNHLKTPLIYKLAVLPFKNSNPDSKADYLGFALADQVIGELNYLQNISIRPSSSIRNYASQDYQPEEVANKLDVDYILSGHYLTIENDIQLNIELVDIRNNQLLWRGKHIQSNYNDTYKLQNIVVSQVVEALKIEFPAKKSNKIQQNIPKSPLAYEYYLRSIAYPYTTQGHQLAIEMLKQSLALDDQYAPTYIQFANRIRRLAQFGLVETGPLQNIEQYYLKALSLNPDMIDAMAYLSMFYTESNRIEEAMELAQIMRHINPNNANTHFTLGYIYRYAGLLDKAIVEMDKAVALDSKNIKVRSLIGTYSATKQYQKRS